METEEYKGFTIKIERDEDAQSPDDGDDGLFLVHYHRDCWIENKKIVTEDEVRQFYQEGKMVPGYWMFPVSAYIHSGVHLFLGTHTSPWDYGGWDTSHVGCVLASKKEWRLRKLAMKCAEGLIETWNQYLSGDVWGYTIEELDDSCWGFYGHDDCLQEAKDIVDYHVRKAA